MIFGVTGGTGCGKTTFLKQAQTLGAVILDCDAMYHRLLRQDPQLLAAIEAAFPNTVENGVLQREKLGKLVFADEAALKKLNAVTHGAVKAEVLRILREKPKFAVIDAIALFESGLNSFCDITVAVTAPIEQRLQRLMLRDGISHSYAQSRIDAQKNEEWYAQKCDYVLQNDKDEKAFEKKCLAFLRQFDIMNI